MVPTRMRQFCGRFTPGFADVVKRVHDFDGFFICDFGVGGGVVLHGERGEVAFIDGIGAEELVFACA